jgi:hypothetical protein
MHKSEQVRTGTNKSEQVRTRPNNSEQVRTIPNKSEQVRNMPSNSEKFRTDPNKSEHVRTCPGQLNSTPRVKLTHHYSEIFVSGRTCSEFVSWNDSEFVWHVRTCCDIVRKIGDRIGADMLGQSALEIGTIRTKCARCSKQLGWGGKGGDTKQARDFPHTAGPASRTRKHSEEGRCTNRAHPLTCSLRNRCGDPPSARPRHQPRVGPRRKRGKWLPWTSLPEAPVHWLTFSGFISHAGVHRLARCSDPVTNLRDPCRETLIKECGNNTGHMSVEVSRLTILSSRRCVAHENLQYWRRTEQN